jgi:SAM-dependent methyltransferase
MDDPVKKTVASYQIKAHEYVATTNRPIRQAQRVAFVDKFCTSLLGPRVLDVGFGSGRDLLHFIQRGLDVEGIELTQAFIDALRPKVAVPLHKMDMRELSFGDSTFDGIWCCASLLHLLRVDALRTLQGFARVLRMNGSLGLTLKEGYGEEWDTRKSSSLANIPRYFSYYTIEEISDILNEAGFKVTYTDRQRNARQRSHPWLNIICVKTCE